MNLYFRRGDIFCTKNPVGWLGYPIHWVEVLRTPTSEGGVTHAGIMLDRTTTYESLWTVKRQRIFDAYSGCHVLVGRFRDMTDEAFENGWKIIRGYEGKYYPVPRIIAFLLVPTVIKYITLARIFGFGLFSDVVCSELVGLFAKYAGMEGFKQFRGLMPAHLSDRIRRWDSIDVVFEGVLP